MRLAPAIAPLLPTGSIHFDAFQFILSGRSTKPLPTKSRVLAQTKGNRTPKDARMKPVQKRTGRDIVTAYHPHDPRPQPLVLNDLQRPAQLKLGSSGTTPQGDASPHAILAMIQHRLDALSDTTTASSSSSLSCNDAAVAPPPVSASSGSGPILVSNESKQITSTDSFQNRYSKFCSVLNGWNSASIDTFQTDFLAVLDVTRPWTSAETKRVNQWITEGYGPSIHLIVDDRHRTEFSTLLAGRSVAPFRLLTETCQEFSKSKTIIEPRTRHKLHADGRLALEAYDPQPGSSPESLPDWMKTMPAVPPERNPDWKLVLASGCFHCHAETASFRCKRCQTARYCNATCQRAHWPSHKLVCSSLAASSFSSSSS